jgi:hypothetical protein
VILTQEQKKTLDQGLELLYYLHPQWKIWIRRFGRDMDKESFARWVHTNAALVHKEVNPELYAAGCEYITAWKRERGIIT